MNGKEQIIEVWGDLACFTRPELKVERFSYPIITPSAARGIYDSIYCKPSRTPDKAEFRWQIKRIEILSNLKFISLKRNEVKEKINLNAVISYLNGKADLEPIWADGTKEFYGADTKGRTQRQTIALKDVRYRIHGVIKPWKSFKGNIQALEAQFRRRASQGKCIFQPYFGCREFPAYFRLIEDEEETYTLINIDMDIGFMLYDVFDLSKPGSPNDKPSISLFRATIVNGVMEIPEYESSEVIKAK